MTVELNPGIAAWDVPVLTGPAPIIPRSAGIARIVEADAAQLASYRRLRREVFVREQAIFDGTDSDDIDEDPRVVVLVAIAPDGIVLGGVRLAPAGPGRDVGWWTGSRLVVDASVRGSGGIGASLVKRACAEAINRGVLRFEATVQAQHRPLFERLGWQAWGTARIGGVAHTRMRFPMERIASLVGRTKSDLAALLQPFTGWSASSAFSLGGPGFVGDDGAPVPGTDLIAVCDAILPALIERDPEWAGWCAVLVNANDLAAMGAAPLGMMNALGASDLTSAKRLLNGLRSGAEAWGIPILGGHSQLGVSPALSVTAFGRAEHPVPGGAGRYGDALSVAVDLTGGWRPGFEGAQWDSTSSRTGEELRTMGSLVRTAQPHAAKDISMAGLVGTVGMLAESSGLGATLEPERIPMPDGASAGDWLSCFPGFGMITADRPGDSRMDSPLLATAEIGALTASTGVDLLWSDGERTRAIDGPVTGLGRS